MKTKTQLTHYTAKIKGEKRDVKTRLLIPAPYYVEGKAKTAYEFKNRLTACNVTVLSVATSEPEQSFILDASVNNGRSTQSKYNFPEYKIRN